MKKEVLDLVVEKSKELMTAPTCSQEARDAAKAWLDAAGTDREAEETKKYIAELEEDIVTVDGLIAFARSEAGAKVFGADAPNVAKHGEEIKAAGAKYCDYPRPERQCSARMLPMWQNMAKRSRRQERNTVTVRPARQWKPFCRRKQRCCRILERKESRGL